MRRRNDRFRQSFPARGSFIAALPHAHRAVNLGRQTAGSRPSGRPVEQLHRVEHGASVPPASWAMLPTFRRDQVGTRVLAILAILRFAQSRGRSSGRKRLSVPAEPSRGGPRGGQRANRGGEQSLRLVPDSAHAARAGRVIAMLGRVGRTAAGGPLADHLGHVAGEGGNAAPPRSVGSWRNMKP